MNKTRKYVLLFLLVISSLFAIKEIYGFLTYETEPVVNVLSLQQNTSYTVVHELMNLDGTTYTEYSHSDYSNVPIGTSVTPEVLTLEGFTSPSTQTVTINSYSNTVITYRYTRNQYTLTVNDSNYVTGTSSGTYYYGETIHLVANATNNTGNPFVKWSDDTTNRDYTFALTGNTTIGPVYALSYTITFEPNNGDSPTTTVVIENNPLNSLPSVSYDDCIGSTGDYHTRQCTYVYKFEGWYEEPTFVNQVAEGYVPTGDITLYAKWNKIYFANDGPFTCTGSNYIDTEIVMFNQINADKDFIVKFNVNQNNGFTSDSSSKFGTIFTDMNESGEPYPGLQFYTKNNTSYTMNINNTTGTKVKNENTGYVTGQDVVIKKVKGIVYYSYNGGNDIRINDFSNFNLYYNRAATFCSGINSSGNHFRFFKGVLSGMSIELIDPDAYTLRFDANGGNGMMLNQIVGIGDHTNINSNQFTNDDLSFGGWNTAPDGSGTSYTNDYAITSDIGNAGDVITLYAQWIPATHFYVHFDANGGIGTMNNQKFKYSSPAAPLTANAFVKTNYEFKGWNTAPDGSGTHYEDEEKIKDLSDIDEDVVTLYAEWWKVQYNHPGDKVFDGTSSTFVDTGINVFSSTNINKDFEIRFTFKSVDSDVFTYTPQQPTIVNVKDESNPYMPGFNIRYNTNNSTVNMTPTYKWEGSTNRSVTLPTIASANAPIHFVYRRRNGVITLQYTYGNYNSGVITMFNQNSWTLNQPFATNVAFGGYFDSDNNPGRFFKGTLADMIVLMDD